MAEKIYFQWQNEVLRNTIYPVRDMKLRHFLLYYKEIDLWAEYKDKKIEDLPKEKAEYEEFQAKAIFNAYKSELTLKNYVKASIADIPDQDLKEYVKDPVAYTAIQTLRGYFKESAPADSEPGRDEIARLAKLFTELHNDFKVNFDKYEKEKDGSARDRKEKIFVTMRIAEWDGHRKELKQKIARKNNLLNDPKVTNKDIKTRERDLFKNILLPGLESELKQLNALVSAQNKLEKRKEEFARRQKENLKAEQEILRDLGPLQDDIQSWKAEQTKIEATIARLTNLPNLADVLNYFSIVNIYDEIRNRLLQAKVPPQQAVINMIIDTIRDTIGETTNNFHDELVQMIQGWIAREHKDPEWILQRIKRQVSNIRNAQNKLDKVILALEEGKKSMKAGSAELDSRLNVINILSDSSDIGIRAIIVNEMNKLEDLQAVVDFSQKADKLGEMIQKARSSLEGIQKKISKTIENIKTNGLEEKLELVQAALQITRDKYLQDYIPDRPVTVKDHIVPYLAEQYNEWLAGLNHDQLLHEVYLRFWNEPERFPLWLQYMVIHFSGMRYASAHGSWADPKELLRNLRTLDIQEELKDKNEDELQAECEGRVQCYEHPDQIAAELAVNLPKFVRATDKNSREKIAHYLTGLKSEFPHKQRTAFFNLSVDEENYEISLMKPEEALEELKAYRYQDPPLPDWMWKEIVKLTDLRLTEVTKEKEEKDKEAGGNWETLNSKEQEQRDLNKDKKLFKYREIMNKWKENNLTGWRAEHDRGNRLIVTRAVCNEIAEHIQHLRGHEGAAGLTQKPNWYMDEEKKYYESSHKGWSGPRAYFVKAKDVDDFEVGASLLWLRFVHEIPNQWRIAKPLKTRERDGLIPNGYLGRNIDSGGWVYDLGEPIMRSRSAVQKKRSRNGPKEKQWLRWMHEATVAAIEETAEGPVVLTFETALPYDDPSLSTIGLFKRYVGDLTREQVEDSYNAAFVGFVPEGKLPASDLEEMLDWNHILLKNVVSAAELEEYRKKYIRNRKPPKTTVKVIPERPIPVKAYLPLCDFVKWTDHLAATTPNLYKVRIWGDPKLPGMDVNLVDTTNFQAVGLYNDKTGRGAVTNFITILREDIDHLMDMQIEDSYEHKHPDWLKQKMNWLCKRKGTIYFTAEGRQGWQTAQSIRWGTLALGGNLVQVVGEEEIQVKMKGGKKWVPMARLAGFTKSNWDDPLDELLAKGLVHRCFCAYKGNKPGDTPKGIVYSPFFGLQEWSFGDKGHIKPVALYIPFEQLVKPGSKEEDGKVYEGIAEKLKCKP